MVTDSAQLQLALDMVGVFVFALSGGLVGVRVNLDLIGVCVLAWIAGLGGGVIRDVFIGATPPVGISDWRLMTVAVVAGLLVFLAYSYYTGAADPDVPARRLRRRAGTMVRVLDAAGLAVFSVAGALKALSFDAGPLAAITVGVITAIGGGLMRDVIAGQIPEVLRRELYAIPALIGAVSVVVAHEVGYLNELVVWGSVILVFSIRILAVVLNLNAPRALRTGDH